ncbi:hypothetical protein GCM10010492_20620 [Saccharothrix mutabilis subsp. mutabilis]|uniref:Uncharacterized protein n=1 Tax=Saccharothrix mutabilis subsp. mutabilis TaxID=66855 RepID=A0ABN0TI98_9PSEU
MARAWGVAHSRRSSVRMLHLVAFAPLTTRPKFAVDAGPVAASVPPRACEHHDPHLAATVT